MYPNSSLSNYCSTSITTIPLLVLTTFHPHHQKSSSYSSPPPGSTSSLTSSPPPCRLYRHQSPLMSLAALTNTHDLPPPTITAPGTATQEALQSACVPREASGENVALLGRGANLVKEKSGEGGTMSVEGNGNEK